MADRVGVMRAGRLEQCAAPGELYDRPATPFVAEFVGTMNRLRRGDRGGWPGAGAAPRPCRRTGQSPPSGTRTSTVLVRPEAVVVKPDADGRHGRRHCDLPRARRSGCVLLRDGRHRAAGRRPVAPRRPSSPPGTADVASLLERPVLLASAEDRPLTRTMTTDDWPCGWARPARAATGSCVRPGEPRAVRTTSLRERPARGPARPRSAEPLLAVAHLSDLHVCDHQSPARVELLDRWADPDSPILERLGEVGHLPRAGAVDGPGRRGHGARGQRGRAGARCPARRSTSRVVTGDNTDNSQSNELELVPRRCSTAAGSCRTPATLSATRASPTTTSTTSGTGIRTRRCRTCRDRAYGFPAVPGLLDAARRPFRAAGLALPWLAVHGNHDQHAAGHRARVMACSARAAVGSAKPVALPAGLDLDRDRRPDRRAQRLLARGARRRSPRARTRQVTADPAAPDRQPAGIRRGARPRPVLARRGTASRHDGRPVLPPRRRCGHAARPGHGEPRTAAGRVRSTASSSSWLRGELTAADAERRYAVLASHHPLETMVNDRAPERRRRGCSAPSCWPCSPPTRAWCCGSTATPTRRRSRRADTWWQVTRRRLDRLAAAGPDRRAVARGRGAHDRGDDARPRGRGPVGRRHRRRARPRRPVPRARRERLAEPSGAVRRADPRRPGERPQRPAHARRPVGASLISPGSRALGTAERLAQRLACPVLSGKRCSAKYPQLRGTA